MSDKPLSEIDNPIDEEIANPIQNGLISEKIDTDSAVPPVAVTTATETAATTTPVKDSKAPNKSCCDTFCVWWNDWTEDGIGVALALVLFLISFFLAAAGVDVNNAYSTTSEWPLAATAAGLGVTYIAHWVLKKKFDFAAYCIILLIAVIARSIGNIKALIDCGLSGSLWAILIGIVLRYNDINLKDRGVFSGEFYVKIGVTLLAMDYTTIAAIGLPGLMVAWGDTLIVLAIGIALCMYVMKFDVKDAVVIAGATCICGSSAATALSASIHEKGYKDEVCRLIIALMGVLNAPLMPIMPLFNTQLGINPAVIGAWIGGSIDSTGQVTASAQMGGHAVLTAAVIIKMAQNILIGPLCLIFTSYFQRAFKPDVLISRFPLFVLGFLFTSLIATIVLQTSASNSGLRDNIIANSWRSSEWMTLIGFACIGLELDIKHFLNRENREQLRILWVYLMIQGIDIGTTFAWSYLMLNNTSFSTDDDDNTDD